MLSERIIKIKIYVASKTKHAPLWIKLRNSGYPIISTWIDESGQGKTTDLVDLWQRCIQEASIADICLVYSEEDDCLKGTLVEMGAALASNKKVIFVAPKEVLTAQRHRLVMNVKSLDEALLLIDEIIHSLDI